MIPLSPTCLLVATDFLAAWISRSQALLPPGLFSALLLCSLLLLFGFASYLDFDDSFEFQVKLGSFFLRLSIVAHRFRLFAIACLRGRRLSFVSPHLALACTLCYVEAGPSGHFSKPYWRRCIFVVVMFFDGGFFGDSISVPGLSATGLFYR
jgi:hypothetical protein